MTIARGMLALAWLLALVTGCHAEDREATGDASELAELLGGLEKDEGYARAVGPRRFRFPQDHGPHPEFRNEWWYLTGNLAAPDGRPFGFEVTFFRVALAPEAAEGEAASAWRSRQLMFAHFAITDVVGAEFFAAERYSRAALELAGARSTPLAVWVEDWRLTGRNDGFHLMAEDSDMRLEIALEGLKPPVLNGEAGLSRKSAAAGNASYYYSLTRLAATGTLTVAGRSYEVAGLAWMDREWSTSALAPDQVGWDWFALQLSDGSDLMLYQLRRRDGSADEHSAGTYTAADGSTMHLGFEDIDIDVLTTWESPRGGVYPAGWRVGIARLGIDLEVSPRLADQELDTVPRYWEGSVSFQGTRDAMPVSGLGYVELTGYADDPLPQ